MSVSSQRIRESQIAAALLLRGLRFTLARAAALHDVPGREREFQGHAYAAFHLLEEAERRRMRGFGSGQQATEKRAAP